jgi:hypothetical protein
MSNKVLMGGIAAGVVFFLLGWVLYGMLLMDTMANYAGPAAEAASKGADVDMIWLVIGNLAMGLFLAMACGWANASSARSGAMIGFWFGLLLGIGMDGMLLGITNIMTPIGMVIDVIVFTVMSVVAGAVAGLVMGMSSRTATA